NPSTTVGDYRTDFVVSLFSAMINVRSEEYAHATNPPLVYGFSYHGRLLGRGKDAFQPMAMPPEDLKSVAIKLAASENERARKFGFTQSELDRAKNETLAYYEKAFNDRDKNNSSTYLGRYQRHFLLGEAIPSIDYEYNLAKQLLPSITLNDVNNVIQS